MLVRVVRATLLCEGTQPGVYGSANANNNSLQRDVSTAKCCRWNRHFNRMPCRRGASPRSRALAVRGTHVNPGCLERVDLHAILHASARPVAPLARMAIKLTAGLWLLTFFAPLTATVLAALLYPERFYMLPNAHKWTVDAQRIRLKDGRHLAYEVRGDISRQHVLIHNHGVLSSRCA